MSNRIAAFVIIWFGIVAFSSEAFAYRPFDGTDAAVVAPGVLEVELGPLGFRKGGSEKTLTLDATPPST
jgi:hypothetical protein